MKKHNILFVLVDSLRADKLFGEAKTANTPNIDKLIKNGVYFEQAITCADGTMLALASMFTGLYPFQTGLGGKSFNKFSSKTRTYFNDLKKNGYQVFAKIPKPIISYGLAHDFDNKEKMEYDIFYRLKDGLDKEILEELKSLNSKEPWLYYIHLLDLHQPVWVPPHLNNEKNGQSQYERMISAIDEFMGKMLEIIDLEKTLVILTADHGEYLPFLKKNGLIISFEDIYLQKTQTGIGNLFPDALLPFKFKLTVLVHKIRKIPKIFKIKKLKLNPYERRSLLNSRSDPDCYLYDELVRTPLIFSGGIIPRHVIVSQQVRNMDIFPTIFGLLSIQDKNERDGKNLISILKGEKTEELPAYMESTAFIKKTKGDVVGIRTSEYKYFRSVDEPSRKANLYDLKNDPLEEKNIAKVKKDVVDKMESLLSQIINKSKIALSKEKMSKYESKKVEEELRKLGYI